MKSQLTKFRKVGVCVFFAAFAVYVQKLTIPMKSKEKYDKTNIHLCLSIFTYILNAFFNTLWSLARLGYLVQDILYIPWTTAKSSQSIPLQPRNLFTCATKPQDLDCGREANKCKFLFTFVLDNVFDLYWIPFSKYINKTVNHFIFSIASKLFRQIFKETFLQLIVMH